ncbi:MAG: hypothetical protein H7A33_01625 [Deltaproteobacteria bacterium]|nr:hypothetical protein [Deltaproteobacteria bacterium]
MGNKNPIKILRNFKQKLILAKIKFITIKILREVNEWPQPDSELVYIFSPHRSNTREPFYTVLARELTRKGFEAYFLVQGTVYNSYRFSLNFKGKTISNSLSVAGFPLVFRSTIFDKRQFNHEADFKNEKYLIDKIDFFPIIKSSLTSANKRLNLDFSSSEILSQAKKAADACDLLLAYFYLFRDFANENSKKIRILITQFIDLPNSVFKFLSDHFECEEVQCITVLPALNKYYFRGDWKNWKYIISNLNKRKLDFGIEVSPDELDSIRKISSEVSDICKSIEKVVLRPVEQAHNLEQKREIQEIQNLSDEYRSRGKSVFVLFGHLFYDLAVIDSSVVFNDLCEWIKKTISFFKDRGDLLILKPHIAELSRAPNETLETFTKEFCKLSDNIRLLHPNSFSLYEISKIMDCGLVWTSSVAMELVYLEVPCVIAGNPVYRALSLNYASSEQNYFEQIENWKQIKVTPEQKNDVACYTYFLEKMQSYPLDVLDGHGWKKSHLNEYLEKGSHEADRLIQALIKEA